MKVQTRKCPNCNWSVYARTESDSRSCKCGGLTVSGRDGSIKITWDNDKIDPSQIIVKEVEIKADNEKLYNDWTMNRNRYGRIKPKK